MKKKRRRSFVFYLLIAFIYIVFFSFPLGKEVILKPVWYRVFSSKDVFSQVGTMSVKDIATFPVKLSNYFGYIDDSGKSYFWGRRDFYTTMSDKYFINYSKVSENFFIRARDGNLESGFRTFGYPFFMGADDRLFVVKTDLTGFSEIDFTGEVKWEREYSSIITSVDVKGEYEAVGILNGKIELLDKKGKLLFSFRDQKSKIPVVDGVAISSDGRYLACISGLEPQKLLVFTRERGKDEKEFYSLYVERKLDSDFRREVLLRFSGDNRFLFFEGQGSLNVFDVESRKLARIPYTGGIEKIVYSVEKKCFLAVGGSDGKGDLLKLIYPLGMVKVVGDLPTSVSFLKVRENKIFVGFGNQLIRVDLERL